MRRLRGITLIEVLCVIAILGIIAAFTYPVLQGGKEKSKEIACAQRLRQIHVALNLYAADYPGYLPIHDNVDIPNAPMLHCSRLMPYLKSRELYYCPDAPSCVRDEYFSTFTWMARFEDTNRENYELYMKNHNAAFGDVNRPHPILYCLIHDELWYYPLERHLSPEFNPPVAVRLYADGSTKIGRFNVLRNFTVAKACSQ